MIVEWLMASLVYPVMIGYSFLMKLVGVTSFRDNPNWIRGIRETFTVGFPVAILEEIVFRWGLMYGLMMVRWGMDFWVALVFSSLFFSVVHFLAGMYSKKTEYNKPADAACLTVGLTLFGMVCGVLHFIPFANIFWHALAIGAAQTNTAVFRDEDKRHWHLWDNGHQIARCWPMWLVMVAWILLPLARIVGVV